MSILHTFDIDGYEVYLEQFDVDEQTAFKGQKLIHPYPLTKSSNSLQMFYTDHDEYAELLANTERYDVKHDGACGALVWDDTQQMYMPYARFDVKKQDCKFILPSNSENWIKCEEMPTSDKATHFPHFRPCVEDKKQYKWYIDTYEKSLDTIKRFTPEQHGKIITVEFMGSKFNQKPADTIDKENAIIPHGTLRLHIPKELRNFEGFKKILAQLPAEGLVAYPEGAQPMKIRTDCFENMHWNNRQNPLGGLSNYVVL